MVAVAIELDAIPAISGTSTVPFGEHAAELGVDVETFHSNIEGEVINRFYAAHDAGVDVGVGVGVDAAVINPAGYVVGHPVLLAAITQLRFPSIELHISNPARRGRRRLPLARAGPPASALRSGCRLKPAAAAFAGTAWPTPPRRRRNR